MSLSASPSTHKLPLVTHRLQTSAWRHATLDEHADQLLFGCPVAEFAKQLHHVTWRECSLVRAGARSGQTNDSIRHPHLVHEIVEERAGVACYVQIVLLQRHWLHESRLPVEVLLGENRN